MPEILVKSAEENGDDWSVLKYTYLEITGLDTVQRFLSYVCLCVGGSGCKRERYSCDWKRTIDEFAEKDDSDWSV